MWRSNFNTAKKTGSRIRDVTDGTSNTFAIGEAIPEWSTHTWWWWYNGSTATCAIPLNAPARCRRTNNPTRDLRDCRGNWTNNYSFMSKHEGGGQFCMADGRVRFISENINLGTYRNLATIGNGEIVGEF